MNPKSAPTTDRRCGTINGYMAHWKRKETACAPCRDAKKIYSKGWKLENQEQVKLYGANYYYEHSDEIRLKRLAKILGSNT